MNCPTLAELPPPPAGRAGWPWTEETPAALATMEDGSTWPRVSIVTPSYNQEAFVEETLRSVLLQGYPDLEYFIADDSTDGTEDILERYSPWIEVLRGETNSGMSAAINRGFRRATGDLVTFVSSDDVYRPGAFQVVARHFREQPRVAAFVGGFHFLDASSRLEPKMQPARLDPDGPVDLTTADPSTWRLHQVATFYTRSTLAAVGCEVREDLRNNCDRELLYRVARHGGVKTMPEAIAGFRIHEQSKSWSRDNMLAMTDEFAEVFLRFLDGDPQADRLRRRNAAYHRAKGYTKFARHSPQRGAAARALLRAATFYWPGVLHKTYLQAWLRVLGLERPIRRVLGKPSEVAT